MSGAGLLALPANGYSDDLLGTYGPGHLGCLLPPLRWPTEVAWRVSAVAAHRLADPPLGFADLSRLAAVAEERPDGPYELRHL